MSKEAYYRMEGDKSIDKSKIANFPKPVYNAPAAGFPLEFGIGVMGQKTRMMGISDGQKVLR